MVCSTYLMLLLCSLVYVKLESLLSGKPSSTACSTLSGLREDVNGVDLVDGDVGGCWLVVPQSVVQHLVQAGVHGRG